MENLLGAWKEFARGKRKKGDVQYFEQNLMHNLIVLHNDLAKRSYRHGPYYAFRISDPKPRNIHKASVRDRVLHHAMYRTMYPFFDRAFSSSLYSCRKQRGTHKAIQKFRAYARQSSRCNARTCWVLKCDIQKFFPTIDQDILLGILSVYIPDADIIGLLREIVTSFHGVHIGKGLPLGNLTSQLLVNVYMNEFDQYVKHFIKARYYVRYADDFVLISHDKSWLQNQIVYIEDFLTRVLSLTLHPTKVLIKTLASGVDFLGWVSFPFHTVLRTATKRRMRRRILEHPVPETIQSYLGLLKHGNTKKLQDEIFPGAPAIL